MHLIVRKRQPKSCWSRQDTNSPELCVNGTSGTFSTQERFILRIICASYYPAVPLSCLNLQQESRSPHMTPGAEVLSQPPSDQLAQGPSIPGVPSHTLYSAALDNMKGTSASITLDNKNISNTSPRRGVLFCTACEPNQSLWLEINTERGIVTSCCTPDLGR
ncbi:uncharacterized protein LOC112431116 [Maylandia zebra]|uniref:uncharacterized protein LOC112431116 n=1 Tax=Maylandia zebra TaxID=106582 RepID=UPI00403C3291